MRLLVPLLDLAEARRALDADKADFDKRVNAAIDRGAAWLKKQQRRDGSWSLVGPYKDGGSSENQIAATAMALLAFQGAGHTHESGEFKKQVADGWNWLLKQQGKDGSFIQWPEGVQY